MGAESRTKKRPRSPDVLVVSSPRKKVQKTPCTTGQKEPGALSPMVEFADTCNNSYLQTTSRKSPKSATMTTDICPLMHTIHQYGLLESLVSCLSPGDLYALALSCKATYRALFPRPESLENLLSRMPCCGTGVAIRERTHQKSTFYYAYQCTEFAQCRTTSGRQGLAEHPCVTCKVTTCDECRIHCVYQSIYETPSDPEELPNFSGFVLLEPSECAILSPHHLSLEEDTSPRWQDRTSNTSAGPYHDQGFLDMPLEIDQPGTPEKISDVLDVDLGRNSLTIWSGSSRFGFPSPVLQSLCDVAEERKLFLCDACFIDAPKGYGTLRPELPQLPWLGRNEAQTVFKDCHCSLRSHVLDRWQCVKCYKKEESTIKGISAKAPKSDLGLCRCNGIAHRTVCMWCWGKVSEERRVYEQAYTEPAARTRAD